MRMTRRTEGSTLFCGLCAGTARATWFTGTFIFDRRTVVELGSRQTCVMNINPVTLLEIEPQQQNGR